MAAGAPVRPAGATRARIRQALVAAVLVCVTAAAVGPAHAGASGAPLAAEAPALRAPDVRLTAPPVTLVLGIAQDGGFPQAGCRRACCAAAWARPELRRHVASLAIVDPSSGECWLIDATPDFREQLHMLDALALGSVRTPAGASVPQGPRAPELTGFLLTHGHVGHYTGLMQLGREVMGTHDVPVYALPRMREFLSHNGPWDQLVRLHNIELRPMEAGVAVVLGARVTVTALLVPHRDEYTETAGFLIRGPAHAVAWIPDIDRWETWDAQAGAGRLESLLREVDAAYLDGTFFSGDELPGRNLDEIPHPLIEATLRRLSALPAAERAKVRFVHLNHTNPALCDTSAARRAIEALGCRVAQEAERVEL